jgi:hypothetical protein
MCGAPGRAADGGILAPNVSHYPVSPRYPVRIRIGQVDMAGWEWVRLIDLLIPVHSSLLLCQDAAGIEPYSLPVGSSHHMSEPSLHPALAPYHDKITSAASAAKLIRPGQHVFVGTACATPRTLVAALENLLYPPLGGGIQNHRHPGLVVRGDRNGLLAFRLVGMNPRDATGHVHLPSLQAGNVGRPQARCQGQPRHGRQMLQQLRQ